MKRALPLVMTATLLALMLAALAACGTTTPEPVVRTVQVNVPVPVYCTENPRPPVYANNDAALAAAPNIFEVVKLHIVGTGQRMDFEREQAAALAVCRGEP